MSESTERTHEERGLSARHLILVFLAAVAVCGVFFSLGFLVGFNEHASRMTPVTERITPPAAIPPTVNPPAESTPPAGKETAPAAAANSPLAEPASPPTTPPGEAKGTTAAPAPAAPAVAAPAPKTEKPAETAPAPAPAASSGEVGVGFTVQVAASRTKEDAEALVKILKGRDYPVFLVAPEYARADDNLYRVQVGPFTTREDAEKVRDKLSHEGFKPFVRH